jgi:quercetin 2,3-dioxygenase
VWPVWNGILSSIFELLNLKDLSEILINKGAGGRVIPMSLGDELSPFLLLVHHKHSFTPFDPFRTITNLITPEGFPAHAHAGFSTVTITIPDQGSNGLVHRDSEGNAGVYNDGDVQYMKAGRGTIHEEMWEVDSKKHTNIELYQLWINSPQRNKFDQPRCSIISKESIKAASMHRNGVHMQVIDGNIVMEKDEEDEKNTREIVGPATGWLDVPTVLAHVTIKPHRSLKIQINRDDICVFHLREGTLLSEESKEEVAGNLEARFGDLIVFDSQRSSDSSENDIVELTAGTKGAKGLFMCAQALDEPVLKTGPFVLSNERDRQTVIQYFTNENLNYFWHHQLGDSEWKAFIGKLSLQGRIEAYLGMSSDQY